MLGSAPLPPALPPSSLPPSPFTTDKTETCLHVCRMGFCGEMWPFFKPNFSNLEKKLEEEAREGGGYTRVYAFIPTGWAESRQLQPAQRRAGERGGGSVEEGKREGGRRESRCS